MAVMAVSGDLQARGVVVTDLLSHGPIDYLEALDLQRKTHQEVVAGSIPSTLILLEHQSIFTAGKRTEAHERPIAARVVDVDRGGKITWHGPGQLIGYPIVRLRDPFEVVGYVRVIESAIIRALAEFKIAAGLVDGRSGVWIEGERKIAAIGIRVAQGVAMHGFAVNVNCSLECYDEIIPCGIADASVTTISRELGSEITIDQFAPVMMREMLEALKEVV